MCSITVHGNAGSILLGMLLYNRDLYIKMNNVLDLS